MDWDELKNAIDDGPIREPEIWFAITVVALFVMLGLCGLVALIIEIL